MKHPPAALPPPPAEPVTDALRPAAGGGGGAGSACELLAARSCRVLSARAINAALPVVSFTNGGSKAVVVGNPPGSPMTRTMSLFVLFRSQ